jgi:hypothetical protein
MVTDPLMVAVRFAIGVVGGIVATLGMDIVMPRLPEGSTPPEIASGVLTDKPPDQAPKRLATVVHYVAGLLTGPLFVWLLFVTEGIFGGQSLLATLGATVVLLSLMVAFFAIVVLPRSQVAAQRLGTIRRDWAISAAVYLVVLVPVVSIGSQLL